MGACPELSRCEHGRLEVPLNQPTCLLLKKGKGDSLGQSLKMFVTKSSRRSPRARSCRLQALLARRGRLDGIRLAPDPWPPMPGALVSPQTALGARMLRGLRWRACRPCARGPGTGGARGQGAVLVGFSRPCQHRKRGFHPERHSRKSPEPTK